MSYRFIADYHLFDVNSLEWRSDLNLSLEDYASMCVYNWNSTVSDDDKPIIVGDVGIECPLTIQAIQAMRGQKILVLGNHDMIWSRESLSKCFSHIVPILRIGNIIVQHEPAAGWEASTYLVHGHHHVYTTNGMRKSRMSYLEDRTRLNCGADLNGHKPCTLLELQVNKENVR